MSADPLDGLARDTRLRNRILLPALIVGIVLGAAGGLAFAFGAFPSRGTGGPRNPAALFFFLAPPALTYAIGWVMYRLLSSRSSV